MIIVCFVKLTSLIMLAMTSHFSEGKGVDSCEEDGGLGSDSGGAIVTVVVTIVITVLCIFVFAFGSSSIGLRSSISSRLSSRFSWLSDDLVVSISFDDNHFVAAGSGPATTAVEDFDIGCS